MRLFLNGPILYFRKWVNWYITTCHKLMIIIIILRFDFVIVVGSFICICIEIGLINTHLDTTSSFRYIAMIRPLKLLRLISNVHVHSSQLHLYQGTTLEEKLFLFVSNYESFNFKNVEVN